MRMQAVIFTGGVAVAGGQSLQQAVRRAQKEQQRLCAEIEQKEPGKSKRPRVAVDDVFARRLRTILRMYATACWNSRCNISCWCCD